MSFYARATDQHRVYNQVVTLALDSGDVKFSLTDLPAPSGTDARPYLKATNHIASKLDTKMGRSRPEKATFSLVDDQGYLRRLFAGLYYYGRDLTLQEGFEKDGVFHARTLMKLKMANYMVDGDTFKITGTSRTLVVDEDIPPQDDPVTPLTYTAQHPITIMRDLLKNQGNNLLVEGDLDATRWDEMRDDWLGGWAMSRTLNKPYKKMKLLQELQQLTGTALFEDENGLISIGYAHPPRPHTTFRSLTDSDLLEAISVDDNQDALMTRAVVYYDYDGLGDENDPASYGSVAISADTELEDADHFGVVKPYNIFCRWAVSDVRAQNIASRSLLRQRGTPDLIKFSLDLKDADILTDTVFDLTTKDILNSVGSEKTTRFHVISRKMNGSRIDLEAQDTLFATNRHYGFIAHAGAADFGAATAVEKEHAYIGDSAGKVNGGTETGYFII